MLGFTRCDSSSARRRTLPAILAAAVGLTAAAPAWAYIGDSFLSIPGVPGPDKSAAHNGWIRAEANDWSNGRSFVPGMGGFGFGSQTIKPLGPEGRSGSLTLMLSDGNPSLPIMKDLCAKQSSYPELTYSDFYLRPGPGSAPQTWFQYKLTNVKFVDCIAAPGAVGEAFTLSFENSQYLNYDSTKPIALPPNDGVPDVKPAVAKGNKKTKVYVITWLGIATDVPENEQQCPKLNAKPTVDDFLRYKSPEEAAAWKAKAGEKGMTYSAESEMRGPQGLDIDKFPAAIPDPGLYEPQSTIAYGMDLHGDKSTSIKKNPYRSPDGRPGIDNQLYKTMGCIPGFRGKVGYREQTDNARRADGNIVTLVEVSGITNEMNDDHVEVALIHSRDKPIRDPQGKTFVSNFTFRPTKDPKFTRFNIRVPGRIVNGVVMTDTFPMYSVFSGQGSAFDLHQAQMRFEPLPDGSVKGYIAGYQDWRYYATNLSSGYSEGLFNYNLPGAWNALKRNADGLKDPDTGEYNGISTVYELDTVPAFLTPDQPELASAK